MSYQRAFEREEDLLCEQVNSGEITQSEFNGAMRELRSEMRDIANEAASDAYNEVMGGW